MTDDRGGGAEWPIDRRRDRIDTSDQRPPNDGRRSENIRRDAETRVGTRRRGLNPIFIALGGVLLLLLVLWLVLGRGSSDQDKLTNASAGNSAATADPEKLCGSKQTYDLMKRELFRKAAQVRGSDQSAFDRLSAYAVVRMQNPVMESDDAESGRVNCSGSLSLDLPPGVAVVGGRHTLEADIDYTVQPAADGSGNVVLIRNADAVTAPLATLARTSQPAAPAPAQDAQPTVQEAPAAAAPGPQPSPAPPVQRQAPAPETSSARPSYNCDNARTRSEKAVCADAGLASLDRLMAAQFGNAMSDADAEQRAMLNRTRSRFLNYRERCGSDQCIADAYRGRIREIRDIMAGRWHP